MKLLSSEVHALTASCSYLESDISYSNCCQCFKIKHIWKILHAFDQVTDCPERIQVLIWKRITWSGCDMRNKFLGSITLVYSSCFLMKMLHFHIFLPPPLIFFFSCNFSPMTGKGTSLTLLRKWQPFLSQNIPQMSPPFRLPLISQMHSLVYMIIFGCYLYIMLLFLVCMFNLIMSERYL